MYFLYIHIYCLYLYIYVFYYLIIYLINYLIVLFDTWTLACSLVDSLIVEDLLPAAESNRAQEMKSADLNSSAC